MNVLVPFVYYVCLVVYNMRSVGQRAGHSRIGQQNTIIIAMDNIINLGIPHVGEQIFESIDSSELLQYRWVSESWKILSEKLLFKRWQGRLIEAVKRSKIEIVAFLLGRLESEEINEDDCFGFGKTAFMYACKNGQMDIVKLFLEHSNKRNIELNAQNVHGMTGVMYACKKGHTDIVKLILDSSAKIEWNASNISGKTALFIACDFGHFDIVKLLINHSKSIRIDLNTEDYSGLTPLQAAHNKGHNNIVELFLAHSK